MDLNRSLVLSVKDDRIDIASISRGSKEIKILRTSSIKSHAVSGSIQLSYNNDENLSIIRSIKNKSKVRSNKVDVILSIDGIITRNIETPIMNKKELESFIKNNVKDYFAVNINEYYYDFEVSSKEKGEGKGKKGKLNIILAAVPKSRLDYVLEFINFCGFTARSIRIYPQAIKNVVSHYSDSSVAVLDTGKEKSFVTIFDKNTLFLYSSISSEGAGEDNHLEEIVENFGYFLNFYSSRHFGNRVDNILITGELWDNEKLYDSIKNQFGIDVVMGIESIPVKIISKTNYNVNNFADTIGNSLKPYKDKDYTINFVKKTEKAKDKSTNKDGSLVTKAAVTLLLITVIWVSAATIYIFNTEKKYNTSEIDSKIAALSYVEKTVSDLNNEKDFYGTKVKYINKVQNEQFDYMSIIDTLRKGLPKRITIKSITLNSDNVNVVFNIKSSTMDVAKLVVAINDMSIFEQVEADQVKLNDEVTEASFNLKIRKAEAK